MWKIARLVLIGKGKGSVDSQVSYRPLCMLVTVGKLLERMLKAMPSMGRTSGGRPDPLAVWLQTRKVHHRCSAGSS